MHSRPVSPADEGPDDFIDFYREHDPGLRRYFLRRIRDRDMAEDLCAETWRKICTRWECTDGLKHIKDKPAFLYRSASNVLISHLRSPNHRNFKYLASEDSLSSVLSKSLHAPDLDVDFDDLLSNFRTRLSVIEQAVLTALLDQKTYRDIVGEFSTRFPEYKWYLSRVEVIVDSIRVKYRSQFCPVSF